MHVESTSDILHCIQEVKDVVISASLSCFYLPHNSCFLYFYFSFFLLFFHTPFLFLTLSFSLSLSLADIPFSTFSVRSAKNGKVHVLTLQTKDQDGVHFDLAADTPEELFEWYLVAWDITQREQNKQFQEQEEASTDTVASVEQTQQQRFRTINTT